MQISKISFSAPIMREQKSQNIAFGNTQHKTNDFYFSKASADALKTIALAKNVEYREKPCLPESSTKAAKLNSKITDFQHQSEDVGGWALDQISGLYNESSSLYSTCSDILDELKDLNDLGLKNKNYIYKIDENNSGVLSGNIIVDDIGMIQVKVKFKNTDDGPVINSIRYKDKNGQIRAFVYKNGDVSAINIGESKTNIGNKKIKERYVISEDGKLASYAKDITKSKDKTKMKNLVFFKNEDRIDKYMKDVSVDKKTQNTHCKQFLSSDFGALSQAYAEDVIIQNGRLNANKIYVLEYGFLKSELKKIKN